MIFVSLDLETTGLDPKTDQILMVGAVIEDTDHPEVPVEDLPHFVCYVRHDRYEGGAFALSLNNWILSILAGRAENYNNVPIYRQWWTSDRETGKDWVSQFFAFLNEHFDKDQKIVLAGKNVASFDYQFLPSGLQKRFLHRFIDPGSVFINWYVDRPLSLDDLKTELDIDGEVAHDALEDARDVVRVLRKSYGKTFKER